MDSNYKNVFYTVTLNNLTNVFFWVGGGLGGRNLKIMLFYYLVVLWKIKKGKKKRSSLKILAANFAHQLSFKSSLHEYEIKTSIYFSKIEMLKDLLPLRKVALSI